MVLAKKICIDQHEQKQNHINTPQKHTQSDTIEGHQSYRSIKTMCTSHGHAQSPSQTFETYADTSSVSLDVNRFYTWSWLRRFASINMNRNKITSTHHRNTHNRIQ
eukprot:209496_1